METRSILNMKYHKTPLKKIQGPPRLSIDIKPNPPLSTAAKKKGGGGRKEEKKR
jgi:hypothetical protein